MSSRSAPFATVDTTLPADSQRPGKRLYTEAAAKQEAPFATDYLPTQTDTDVGQATTKRSGLRRFGTFDQPEEPIPYAEAIPHYQTDMWAKQKEQATASVNTRNIAQRPQDHGFLFRQEEDPSGRDMQRSGKKRYSNVDDKAEAPFCLYMKGDVGMEPVNSSQMRNGNLEVKIGENASSIKDSPFTRLN